MIKFHNHFFGGMLVGASLSGILVFSFAFRQISINEELSDLLFGRYSKSIEEISDLRSVCGDTCSDVASHRALQESD